MFKINFDGAISKVANKFGICVVIRDNQGLAITSFFQQLPQAYRVEEIEALVVARALEFAFEIGIDSAVLEGNSELIIKALTDEDPLCRSFGSLIVDAKFCSSSFNQLRYFHIKRECNKVAHNLVKYAINVLNYVVWMEAILPHLSLYFSSI